MKKIFIIIGSILLALLLAYNIYFKDLFDYLKVKEERTIESCNLYYREHPNGFFLEDVKFIEIELQNDIIKIKEFIKQYPNSEYMPTIKLLKFGLWQKEIDKYLENIKGKKTNDLAVKFFNDLLYYMRDNDLFEINIFLNGSIKLKEYEEYEEKTKIFCERIVKANKLPSIEENLIPLKSNFESSDISELEAIIVNGISMGFNKIINKEFLDINANGMEIENTKRLKIIINYEIINQEETFNNIKIPHIWNYYSSENTDFQKSKKNDIKNFKNYLLGISVKFDFQFIIPNNINPFKYNEVASPSDEINNIDGITDGYKKMTSITFANFSKNITELFSLY